MVFRNTRQQADNEVVYNTQLNGDTHRAPPWPVPRHENEIMFVLPRKLNSGDKINVTGVLKSNPGIMSVNLVTGDSTPDYQNIACQFEARFPNGGNNEDRILIKVIENGYEDILKGNYEEMQASGLFTGSNFTFGFSLRIVESNYEDIPIVKIHVDGSYIHQFQLKHNISNIRYLTLNGDIEKIEKLDFEFS